MARWLGIALGLALAITALAITAPALAADQRTADTVTALNTARAARGLPPVAERAELTAAATAHARDMAARRYFAFDPPGRATFRDRFVAAGYVPASSRVLLGAGYPVAHDLMQALLGDPQTSGSLLDPVVGEIGVGRTEGVYQTPDGPVENAWILVLASTGVVPVDAATDGLLAAINRARAARRLPAVSVAAGLTAAASDHALDMVERGFFGHATPDGLDVADRARRHRYDFRKVGENLAAGQTTPEEVVQGWSESPGHARVMFDPDFAEIGVGYLPGLLVEPARSLGHIWVAVFGQQR